LREIGIEVFFIMSNDTLRYDKMIDVALRGVVKESLRQAADKGLPGNHHFYLTFRTGFPGVQMPAHLRAQYPEEITIVLQYQFYGLEVTDERFGVTLSFGGKHEFLSVPLAAITTFADPSVDFALQFQAGTAANETAAPAAPEPEEAEKPAPAAEPAKRGEVVALDAFRKK
jgi:uncharacterized protein